MATTELRFHWLSDDTCNIYLDNELIFEINHDTLDRYSMIEVEAAFRSVAHKAGWNIISVWEEHEEWNSV